MKEFIIGEIKISHLEPNNCYPNSREYCVVSYKDFKESFSYQMGDNNLKIACLQDIFDRLSEKIAKEI